MTITSPQADIAERRDNYRLMLDLLVSNKGVVVAPPLIVTANGQACARKEKISFRVIQNCGTLPVKFLVDDVATAPTTDMFHGILAACTTVDDGTGGSQSFGLTGNRVTILGVGGNPRVCIFEGYAPEGLP